MPEAREVSRTRKTKGTARKSTAETISDKTLAPLELLPIELFRTILSNLPLASLLALPFVSRKINEKMKDESGKDFIEVWRGYHRDLAWDEKARLRQEYLKILIAVEAATPAHVRLPKLTCWSCCRRRGNSIKGFDDAHFDRLNIHRRCLSCLSKNHDLDEIQLEGTTYAKCWSCIYYNELEYVLTVEDVRELNRTMLGKVAEVSRTRWPELVWKIQEMACKRRRMCLKCCVQTTASLMLYQTEVDKGGSAAALRRIDIGEAARRAK